MSQNYGCCIHHPEQKKFFGESWKKRPHLFRGYRKNSEEWEFLMFIICYTFPLVATILQEIQALNHSKRKEKMAAIVIVADKTKKEFSFEFGKPCEWNDAELPVANQLIEIFQYLDQPDKSSDLYDIIGILNNLVNTYVPSKGNDFDKNLQKNRQNPQQNIQILSSNYEQYAQSSNDQVEILIDQSRNFDEVMIPMHQQNLQPKTSKPAQPDYLKNQNQTGNSGISSQEITCSNLYQQICRIRYAPTLQLLLNRNMYCSKIYDSVKYEGSHKGKGEMAIFHKLTKVRLLHELVEVSDETLKYQGEFSMTGDISGQGTLIFGSGKSFDGGFRLSTKQGKGVLTLPKKEVKEFVYDQNYSTGGEKSRLNYYLVNARDNCFNVGYMLSFKCGLWLPQGAIDLYISQLDTLYRVLFKGYPRSEQCLYTTSIVQDVLGHCDEVEQLQDNAQQFLTRLNGKEYSRILFPVLHSRAHYMSYVAEQVQQGKYRLSMINSLSYRSEVFETMFIRAFAQLLKLDLEIVEEQVKSAQQKNPYDCGVYTCHFMNQLLKNPDRPLKDINFEIHQDIISQLKQVMKDVLLGDADATFLLSDQFNQPLSRL